MCILHFSISEIEMHFIVSIVFFLTVLYMRTLSYRVAETCEHNITSDYAQLKMAPNSLLILPLKDGNRFSPS